MDFSSFANMFTRLLQSPVIDAILILLAIRFLWPGLFGIRKKKAAVADRGQRNFVNKPTKEQNPSKDNNSEGEYIDYEEIK